MNCKILFALITLCLAINEVTVEQWNHIQSQRVIENPLYQCNQTNRRGLAEENTITNATIISFNQTTDTLTSKAYQQVLNSPKMYSTNYILYPYNLTFQSTSDGTVTLPDGAFLTLPNTTLPLEGTSFKYFKTSTDVKFSKAKPIYDIHVGIFSMDIKQGSVTMDVFQEASSYCSILSFKYGDCIESSAFSKAINDIKNVGKTFLVYLAPEEVNAGILFTNDSQKRFGLIILPDYALGSEAIIGTNYLKGIESLKKYVNEGGKVIASGKSGYLLQKWGILPAGTYDPSKIVSSIETNSVSKLIGCEASSDDFTLRTLCMSFKQSDSTYKSFTVSSFKVSNSSTFTSLMKIDPADTNTRYKDASTGKYSTIAQNDTDFPYIMTYKQGNGLIIAINGNPASKSTYKQLLYNLLFVGMAKPILFNVELQTTDGLPIPGGEAGIIVTSKVKIYNLFESNVTNVKLYVYLPNNISAVDPLPSGCSRDASTYLQFSYVENISSVNKTNLITCSQPALNAFQKLDITLRLEILDASATQCLYDIMMLYPILQYEDSLDTVLMDYGGFTTTAQLAALLRTTLNPDPVGFFPLFGKGQYVDNVLNVENKEGTEAFDVDYIAVVPLISPIVDSNDQSAVIKSLEFLNRYYQEYGYIFPFRELDAYDMLDIKNLTQKGVVLVAEWDDPVKAGKEFRNVTTHPEFPNLEAIPDSPLDIVNLGMTVQITNVNYAIKQIYFKNADLFFEHASARQIVWIEDTTANGARTLYQGVFPPGVKNPNKAEDVAKVNYLWCRQDIYFYDVESYPRPTNIGVNDVFTMDKYPRQSPLITEDFGKGSVGKYDTGYFNSSLPGGLKKHKYYNAMLMYQSKNPINMTGNTAINETTNNTVRLIHYLVPLKDKLVTHASDIMGFTQTVNDEGYLTDYPDVKFIYAFTTYLMIPGNESRQGGMIQIEFNNAITNGSVTFSADQIAFYKIEYDLVNNIVKAFYKRGLFSNEAYGKPSNISVSVENIASVADIQAKKITLYEMKFDLSSKATNYESYMYRKQYTNVILYRSQFFSLPAIEMHIKLPRVNGSIMEPYELLDPYARFGVYYQELISHSTVWVLVESHHQSDPGMNTLSSAYSMISNIGISSIPFIEYLTVGAGQLIPFVEGTSRVEWNDIWGRRWVQPQRSVFADVVPLPGPTLNFMMSTTFELTKRNKTERVLYWNTEEDLDIRVHIKVYNNYPKYFDLTYCKDNEVPYMETGRGKSRNLIYAAPESNGSYPYQITTSSYPSDDYHINFANRAVYGMCYDMNGTRLEGNDLTQEQINTISTAHLCAEDLNETKIKECIIQRLAEHLPTIHRFDKTWANLTKWIYSPDVLSYYPASYISQDMFDLSHPYYDDTPFTKSFPYHMDNTLPQIDTSLSKPQNIIAQPIYKGLGYKITYNSNMTLARYPNYKGWWSDNLQNKDKTLLAAQNISNEVSVDKDTLLTPDKWINIKDLKNPFTNASVPSLKNIYVCLYNQYRVKLNVSDKVIGHLFNVVQNNIVPIIPDLEKDDPRLTSFNCSGIYQYAPENISMIDNVVYTPTIRDWLYFAANLRGEALESINIPMQMTAYSSIEGLVKVQDGGRYVYWNPCCGPNTFMIVDNPVNLVEAMKTNVQVAVETFPKQTPTFNANIYSLFTITDPNEIEREWKELTYDNHFGFGDSVISVFVGGTKGSKSILNVGDTTYIKLTLYNNAGYDWHMFYGAIEFQSMPTKPTGAMYFQGLINAIQAPTKYNFINIKIPAYLQSYITMVPSDHNCDVSPQFFDFQNINVVTIKDGFKGDYFFKLTLTSELPIKYQGRVHEIGFELNETYFDHLPGYNDLAKAGYHDYKLSIPSAKIGIPFSNGPRKGKVYYTSGYSYNVSLSFLLPNYLKDVQMRIIRDEQISGFRSASSDDEKYDQLMSALYDTYPIINATLTNVVADTSFNNVTTNALITKFPLYNEENPDNATFYVLMKSYAPQIASGTNIILSNPIVRSINFVNASKNATIASPNYRTVKSYGAWIMASYNTTVMKVDENGNMTVNPDQRIFNTDSGVVRVRITATNIGGKTAYNVNFTLTIGDGAVVIDNLTAVSFNTLTNSTGNYYNLLTQRKIPVGEIYSEDVYLRFVPFTRRRLDSTSRSFIKSVATSIDLTEAYGQSQVTQSVSTPSPIYYQTGLREISTLMGTALGYLKFNNLSINLVATTENVSPTVTAISYIFKKKLSAFNITDSVEYNKLKNMTVWSVIRSLDISNNVTDEPFPNSLNATTLNSAAVQYIVESYDNNGKFLSSNLWEYNLMLTDQDKQSSFPWYIILLIALLGGVTIGIIIAIIIIKRKRKSKIVNNSMVDKDIGTEGKYAESHSSNAQSYYATDTPIANATTENLQPIVEKPNKDLSSKQMHSIQVENTIDSKADSQGKSIPLDQPSNSVLNETPIQEYQSPLSSYVPIKNDKTDSLLAEELQQYFVNHPEINIQMERVKEGVYMYGNTKLGVVVANGRVIIRVGGGYMSLEEFLNTYTPIEMAKNGRSNVYKSYEAKIDRVKNMKGVMTTTINP